MKIKKYIWAYAKSQEGVHAPVSAPLSCLPLCCRVLLAVGGADNAVRLYLREADGACTALCTLKGHTDWVTSVAFTSSGRFIPSECKVASDGWPLGRILVISWVTTGPCTCCSHAQQHTAACRHHCASKYPRPWAAMTVDWSVGSLLHCLLIWTDMGVTGGLHVSRCSAILQLAHLPQHPPEERVAVLTNAAAAATWG